MTKFTKYLLVLIFVIALLLVVFLTVNDGYLQLVWNVKGIHRSIPWCDELYTKLNPFDIFKVCKIT